MSASKRADTLASLQKILHKHYKPHKNSERPVLEQLLFACCLEDSKPDAAEEAFARLEESFFDWNEVRVTTVRELSELLRGLRDPERAATALKQTLHSVYETIYDFNLDGLQKLNLGVAVKQLEQYRGTTPFSVAFVVQNSLGGHAIPVSRSAFETMVILGLASEKDAATQSVSGLERAVPKNKGVEFASLLQQFAADYAASPFGTNIRNLLLEIEPTAKDRFPKRGAKKAEEPSAAPPEAADDAKKKAAGKAPTKPTTKQDAKSEKKEVAKKEVKKDDKTKAAAKSEKPVKKVPKKKPADAAPDKKKPTKKSTKPIAKKASPTAKKSASKQLARRKPR